MKITAIISEFNPFHKGHKYLIDKARENGATYIVAVMSGNFVQRGESAAFSKWDRAKIALENGVDLVVENPLLFATASAQRFAFGGIGVIKGMGCVDEIAFGSESGNIDELIKVADFIAEDDYSQEIQKYLKDGVSFPQARQMAICEKYGEEYGNILSLPNNILACEYISECKKSRLDIDFFTTSRIGAQHDGNEKDGYYSASDLRQKLRNNIETNDELFEYARNNCKAYDFTKLETAILVKLRNFTIEDFKNLPDVSEGMENRLYSAVQNSTTVAEFVELVKTKRYTHSRIRRICLYTLLGISKSDVTLSVPYIRIIGLNEKGKDILRIARDKANLPVVMKYSDIKSLDENAQHIFEIESKATDLFALCSDKILSCGLEKTENIIIK